MAINNPYVPGDPYSYDLKWIVKQLKALLRRDGLKVERIPAADLIDWDSSRIPQGLALVDAYRIGNDVYFSIANIEVGITQDNIRFTDKYAGKYKTVEYFPLLTTSPGGYWLDTIVGYYQIASDRITFTNTEVTPITCRFSGHFTLTEV